MRDRRKPWSAQVDFVSGERVSKLVSVRCQLDEGRGVFQTPDAAVGRRVVIQLTPDEADSLAASLQSMAKSTRLPPEAK